LFKPYEIHSKSNKLDKRMKSSLVTEFKHII
jgi:hypothetical protein